MARVLQAGTAGGPSGRRYLFGGIPDTLLLGGASIVVLLIIRLVSGTSDDARAQSLVVTLFLANLINHPHFAQSYLIFYRDFAKKLSTYPTNLRLGYLFSGVVVPLLLAGCMFLLIMRNTSPGVLGYITNFMFFLVGWHYVKQGYGMCMVGAALQRAFFTPLEKKLLLINAYAVWVLSWVLQNEMVAPTSTEYWGIPFNPITFPDWTKAVLTLVAAATTAAVAIAIMRRLRLGKPLAAPGFLAYVTTLYLWLLVRDPIVLLWIPLFHSIQYMTVVARLELNRTEKRHTQKQKRLLVLFLFYIASVGLGYFFFWQIPSILDQRLAQVSGPYGGALFIYCFWVFINIHHYFLDTIMWRKGNPDVAMHLFSHRNDQA